MSREKGGFLQVNVVEPGFCHAVADSGFRGGVAHGAGRDFGGEEEGAAGDVGSFHYGGAGLFAESPGKWVS